MRVKPFEPQFMKIGVLTAALQELTPREVRDKDPDKAIEDWVAFARELGADYIQLSAALHPTKSDVPPEAMLDPVANTLDLRKPFDKERAKRAKAALKAHNVASEKIKVNDLLGNPIEIGAVVVWQVRDTAQARFDVQDFENYVNVQIETTIRHLASSHPYEEAMGDGVKSIFPGELAPLSKLRRVGA